MTVKGLDNTSTVYVFLYDDLMYGPVLDQVVDDIYEIVGAAILPNHELNFTVGTIKESYATIKYKRDSYIEGVLYNMTRTSFHKLKELYSDSSYSVLHTMVEIEDINYGCRVFIAHNRCITPQLPTKEYLACLIAGAYANGLSREYTDYLTDLEHLNNNVKILKEFEEEKV